ncbi:MAG TPA: CDP-alcohol phosphatidyltransferase family protein [Acidimicrobiales bacterium]|nr:CDP-alcohol phosphatidyltransferase family protein [Acidimicrobiales bacterium]
MIDARLRPVKDRVLDPVAARVPGALTPLALSGIALGLGLAAAGAAGAGWSVVAVAAWLTGRVVDGLDGAVARQRGQASDVGGYLDIVLDTVVYAAVPLGVAAHLDERGAWIVVAVLLGAFYVNAVSWAYLSAVLEKRAVGAASTGESTTVTMPRGLVEGAETIVIFTVALAVPSVAPVVFAVMAGAVLVGAAARTVVAVRRLGGAHQ